MIVYATFCKSRHKRHPLCKAHARLTRTAESRSSCWSTVHYKPSPPSNLRASTTVGSDVATSIAPRSAHAIAGGRNTATSPPPRLRRSRGHATRRSVMLRRDTRLPVDTRGKAPDGAAIAVAERRKRPELLRPGPQRLCILACEAGGRWSAESLRFVTQLARLKERVQRTPAALRGAAKQGWLRRWWGLLSVALQSTLAGTLLGVPYVHGAMPGAQLPALASPTAFPFGVAPSWQSAPRSCQLWTRQGRLAVTNASQPELPCASLERPKSGHTPNSSAPHGAGWLWSGLSSEGDGVTRQPSSSDSSLVAAPAQPLPCCDPAPGPPTSPAGQPSSPLQPHEHWPRVFSRCPSPTPPMLMGKPWS